MSFACALFAMPKDPESNGGYISIGDGNVETTLHLSKDGVSIKLNDSEILELISNLRGFV